MLAPWLLVPLVAASPNANIVNGSRTSDWPAVGMMLACWNQNSCFSYCTGTLVHESWVVTAAHCVDALHDYKRSGYAVRFGIGADDNNVQEQVDVRSYAEHPDYSSRNLSHDIGIVELSQAITSAEPIPVNEESVTQQWVGSELSYVGYGVTGDNASDGGIKRTADIPVEGYSNQVIYGLDVRDGQNICYGDSGGAALEHLGEGVYELAGVNSYVYSHSYNNRACEGGGSGATRVDTHMDFITSFVDVGGYEPPEEPEPEEEVEPEDEGGAEDPGPADEGEDYGALVARAADIVLGAGDTRWTRVFVEGDPDFEWTVVEIPEHGAVTDADGDWVEYTADSSHVGPDRFTLLVVSDDGEAELGVNVEVLDDRLLGFACASGAGAGPWWIVAALVGLLRRREERGCGPGPPAA